MQNDVSFSGWEKVAVCLKRCVVSGKMKTTCRFDEMAIAHFLDERHVVPLVFTHFKLLTRHPTRLTRFETQLKNTGLDTISGDSKTKITLNLRKIKILIMVFVKKFLNTISNSQKKVSAVYVSFGVLWSNQSCFKTKWPKINSKGFL